MSETLFILKGNYKAAHPVARWNAPEDGADQWGPLAFATEEDAKTFIESSKAFRRGYAPAPATMEAIREIQKRYGWKWLWTGGRDEKGVWTFKGITLPGED